MLENITACGRQLTEPELSAAEARLHLRLPDAYRDFLKSVNGGVPHPNAFLIQGMAGNPADEIRRFFGIGVEEQAYDLVWNADTLQDRLPPEFLAIASTPSGDLVCIGVDDTHAGAIFFWDTYSQLAPAEWQPSGYSSIYQVASSFSDLLACLGVFPTA
jgi:hypothetical protein